MSKRDISLSVLFVIVATLAALFLSRKNLLAERAKRGSRVKFDAALAKVPDVSPDEHDRL